MDLEDIKRGLRAEIKKMENEQYFTFQCNVRQMCKDVLAKLEEKESEIAEKDKEIQRLENLCESYRIDCDNLAIREANAYKEIERDNKQIRHQKYKRCLAMARICEERYNYLSCLENWQMTDKEYQQAIGDYWDRWYKRWLELAERFKEEAKEY